MEAQIPIFLKTPLSYKPGTDSSYSNMNYALLGAVIEAVTGEAYGDHMQRVLFDPLGLSRTASVYRPDMRVDSASGYMGSFSLMDWMLRLFYPAELREGLIVQDSWFGDKELGPFAFNAHGFGDLIGSVRDVAEFLRFHLDPGDPAFERILPKDWRERMRVNQGGSYAMSWALGRTDGAATFSHTGGGPGFSSYVCIVPSRGFGLALLGNRFTTTSPPLKEMMAAAGASSNNI
jgi:CubicO group peptidase (beta-lactamase class C family)